MPSSIINSHNTEALIEYFDIRLATPPTVIEKFLSNLDLEGKFEIPWLKISVPWSVLRPFIEDAQWRIAARRWISPRAPIPTLADLKQLQQGCGFAKMAEQQFAHRLKGSCVDLQRHHPSLIHWIRRRASLLDLTIDPPPPMPSELSQASVAFRQRIFEAQSHLSTSPAHAVEIADSVSENALNAAAQAVCSVFGGDCRVSANLMVPVARNSALPSTLTSAQNRAHQVFGGYAANKKLLVVAETRHAGHVGFWVPVVRGIDMEELPGAPYAVMRQAGHAVFKDDLPLLLGFPEDVRTSWFQYMAEHFDERLFVSVPFRAPTSHAAGTGTTVAAVVNVNASPQHEEYWFRAYHPEWLNIVEQRVAPFAEVAFYAFMIRIEANRPRTGVVSTHLDTGSMIWDRLPAAELLRLPGEGDDGK